MSFQVVRKKLTPNEITPPNVRYNPDCDCVETSVDGGVTWTPNPGADPRSSPAFRGPALTGLDAQCDAAANMVAALQTMVAADVSADNLLSLGTLLLSIALLFVPGAGWVADVFLIAAEALILLDQATIEAAFTPTVYDELLCTFRSHLDTDGQMSDTQLTDFLADVAANYDSTVQGAINNHSSTLGAVGWSNAGSLGHETGDCDECGWCWEWDFTIDQQGWDVFGIYGEYVPGEGFRTVAVGSAYSLIAINSDTLDFSWSFTGVTVGYNTDPTGDGDGIIEVGVTDGATFTPITDWSPVATPNPNTYTFLHDDTITQQLYVNPNGGDNSIVATVKSILIRGVGTLPAFAYGHEC